MTSQGTAGRGGPRRQTMFAAAIAAVALGAGAVYGIGFAAGNKGAAACAADEAVLVAIDAAATGEVAGLIVADEAEPAPELRFLGPGGEARALADWQGKVVLLNLWATWCAPCREEMPALDALQAAHGGEDFEVVAVSVDRGGPEKPAGFYEEIGIEHLALYHDPESQTFNALKQRGQAFGLPTTLLVDRDGCTLGHMPGPADWASDDATALVRAATARPASD